jgi:hypothetical protein
MEDSEAVPYRTGCRPVPQSPLADGQVELPQVVVEDHLGGLDQPAPRVELPQGDVVGDDLRHLVGPVVEDGAQQLRPVLEVPVEARPGDSLGAGQLLDRDLRDAAPAAQGGQARLQPFAPGDSPFPVRPVRAAPSSPHRSRILGSHAHDSS